MSAGADTSMGGNRAGFPTTNWGSILAVRDKDQRTQDLGTLVHRYWKPVYHFIRAGWSKTNEEAKDLTQDFFAFLLEVDLLRHVDPAKGRLRSFLKACLRNFLRDEHKRAGAAKRGGGVRVLSLDDTQMKDVISEPRKGSDEERFDHSWTDTVIREAVESLKARLCASGREREFELFRLHDVEAEDGNRPSYGDLAKSVEMEEQAVKSGLDHARALFRRLIRDAVRESCTSDQEAMEEFREIFLNP